MHIVECVLRKTLCSIKVYFYLKCCELSAVSLCVFKSKVRGSNYNCRLCFLKIVICIMIQLSIIGRFNFCCCLCMGRLSFYGDTCCVLSF